MSTGVSFDYVPIFRSDFWQNFGYNFLVFSASFGSEALTQQLENDGYTLKPQILLNQPKKSQCVKMTLVLQSLVVFLATVFVTYFSSDLIAFGRFSNEINAFLSVKGN